MDDVLLGVEFLVANKDRQELRCVRRALPLTKCK